MTLDQRHEDGGLGIGFFPAPKDLLDLKALRSCVTYRLRSQKRECPVHDLKPVLRLSTRTGSLRVGTLMTRSLLLGGRVISKAICQLELSSTDRGNICDVEASRNIIYRIRPKELMGISSVFRESRPWLNGREDWGIGTQY